MMTLRSETAGGVWWATTIALLALFLLSAIAYLIDERTIDGVSVWAKPMKFQISLAVHFATLAAAVAALGVSLRQSRWLLAVALAATAATAFEIAYIMAQAAQQLHSHFNVALRSTRRCTGSWPLARS